MYPFARYGCFIPFSLGAPRWNADAPPLGDNVTAEYPLCLNDLLRAQFPKKVFAEGLLVPSSTVSPFEALTLSALINSIYPGVFFFSLFFLLRRVFSFPIDRVSVSRIPVILPAMPFLYGIWVSPPLFQFSLIRQPRHLFFSVNFEPIRSGVVTVGRFSEFCLLR